MAPPGSTAWFFNFGDEDQGEEEKRGEGPREKRDGQWGEREVRVVVVGLGDEDEVFFW